MNLPLGPLMIDIAGKALADLDRQRMRDPRVGGVILFTRNYESPAQLAALCGEIHALRSPALLIAVDHEGGRVQRFREGFAALPPMHALGEWWQQAPRAAVESARAIGYLMAAELRACGVDLSFAPVLDLDWGTSGVIGNRSFHRDPQAVIALAGALIAGMREAGMACCGKHYPGHGFVTADSHIAIPVDERTLEEMAPDLEPYRRLKLDGVMPAHVIYPKVDSRPAGFSPVWIAKLRQELGFDGVIFSDDLSMEGASFAGGTVERIAAAASAGVDMLLVCNAPDKVGEVLERWQPVPDAARGARIAGLLPRQAAKAWAELKDDITARAGHQVIARLAGIWPGPGLG